MQIDDLKRGAGQRGGVGLWIASGTLARFRKPRKPTDPPLRSHAEAGRISRSALNRSPGHRAAIQTGDWNRMANGDRREPEHLIRRGSAFEGSGAAIANACER